MGEQDGFSVDVSKLGSSLPTRGTECRHTLRFQGREPRSWRKLFYSHATKNAQQLERVKKSAGWDVRASPRLAI